MTHEAANTAPSPRDLAAVLQGLRLTGMPRFYRCEPSWFWEPPQPLLDFDVWIVTAGRGELYLDARRHRLGPQQAFVLRPGERPRGYHDPADRLRVFACHFDLLDPAGHRLPARLTGPLLPPAGHTVRDPAMLNGLMQGAVSTWRADDPLAQARARLYVGQILLQLLAESRRHAAGLDPADSAMARLATAIQEEPGRPWTVGAMAAQMHLSRAQFTRRFAAAAGMPPARFVIHARVSRATTLLRETTMTLAAIADDLGYADVFYFSRQYKAERGHPPSAERARQGRGLLMG